MNQTEIWKEVPNFNGRYFASESGKVKTISWRNSGKESILKPAKDKKGYLKTVFVRDGKNIPVRIHRIIALTFIPNPDNKPEVNHKNFIKDDNSKSNLEWCTGSENVIHGIVNGKIKIPTCPKEKKAKGSKNGASILNEQQVKEIRLKFKPRVYTRQMLGEEYGVSPLTIKDVILRRWKHVL
jgi:hypothetical protein